MLQCYGGRCQTTGCSMASPQDALTFQKRKLVRLAAFTHDRDEPGNRPVVVGDEDGLAVAHLFNQRTQLIFGGGY